MSLLYNVASAWLALLLAVAAAAIALTARAARRPRAGLAWHIVSGALVPLVATLHAMAAMGQGGLRLLSPFAVGLATTALAASVAQAGLGAALQDSQGPTRRRLRPLHFALMIGLALTAGGHAWLNRT